MKAKLLLSKRVYPSRALQCCWALVCVLLCAPVGNSQGNLEAIGKGPVDVNARRDGLVSVNDKSPLALVYHAKTTAFVDRLRAVNRIIVEYDTSTANDRAKKYAEWTSAMQAARDAYHAYVEAACELFLSNPANYASLGNQLFEILKTEVEHDRFEGCPKIGETLFRAGSYPEDLYYYWGYAELALNHYDRAIEIWTQGKGRGQLARIGEAGIDELRSQAVKWQQELIRRAEDEKKNDLPRVQLTTTKGDIVIELFEDDAPETVNNFIYLFEHRFYDGKTFFRVEKNFCAQTGCDRGDGTGTPGYTIRGEMGLPTARNHFRGSISVALGSPEGSQVPDPDSGGSQFFFCLMHGPKLDGKYCVFGRVIEGLEVLGRLKQLNFADENERKTSELVPDRIVSAQVIRKRPHPYEPVPVTGKPKW